MNYHLCAVYDYILNWEQAVTTNEVVDILGKNLNFYNSITTI